MKKKLLFAVLSCLGLLLAAGCSGNQSVDMEERKTEEQEKEKETEKKVIEEKQNEETDEIQNETKKPESTEKEKLQQTEKPEQPTPSTDTDEPQEKPISDSSYALERASFQTDNLTIRYPQLKHFNDKEKETRINQLIEDEVLFYIQQHDDPKLTMTMDYEVTLQTPEKLSIIYAGESSIEGGMYPTQLLFTTNIDLTSGKKIKTLEQYTINDDFVEKLRTGSYLDRQNLSQSNKEKIAAIFDFLISIPNTELINALKQADNPNITNENIWGVFTYQTPDSIVVSIQVPHALGDFAEILLE